MWRGLTLLAATELGSAMKRSVMSVVIYALAALSFLCALGFLVAAGHGSLAERYGDTMASLILAGIFFLVAIVIALFAGLARRQARRRRSLTSTALVVAPVMAPPALRAFVAHPAIGAGVVAGIVALGAMVGRQWGKTS
jgi:cytochrome bd-type quinol oxidase subunit 2